MKENVYEKEKIYMGRLPQGSDVLVSLGEIAKKNGIKSGQIQLIGAVQCAVVGYYDQDNMVYKTLRLEGHYEVLCLTGNISLKDEEPFIHAHVVLGDAKGICYGGHLMEGTRVFAGEYIVREFVGEEMKRVFDEKTGLYLW